MYASCVHGSMRSRVVVQDLAVLCKRVQGKNTSTALSPSHSEGGLMIGQYTLCHTFDIALSTRSFGSRGHSTADVPQTNAALNIISHLHHNKLRHTTVKPKDFFFLYEIKLIGEEKPRAGPRPHRDNIYCDDLCRDPRRHNTVGLRYTGPCVIQPRVEKK